MQSSSTYNNNNNNNNSSDNTNLAFPHRIKPVIDFAAIEAALRPSTQTEGATLAEMQLDQRMCPICHHFETWNTYILKDHIENHKDYQEHFRWDYDCDLAYRKLLHERSELKRQLTAIMNRQIEKDREIERFEKSDDAGPLAAKLRTEWIAQMLRGETIRDDMYYGDLDFGDNPVTELERDFVSRKRGEEPEESGKQKGLHELLNEEANRRILGGYNHNSNNSKLTKEDVKAYSYTMPTKEEVKEQEEQHQQQK